MNKLFARARRKWADGQRGAVAVEFALVLPVLLLLLFGIMDFGWIYSQHISLQSAAREGARQGVIGYPVMASVDSAKGNLDGSKMQIKYAVDSAAAPGNLVVCLRYPLESVTGFFSLLLKDGYMEVKDRDARRGHPCVDLRGLLRSVVDGRSLHRSLKPAGRANQSVCSGS